MNNKGIFNAKGLTLVELIVTMAIFVMIIMVVYPMISFTYKTSNTQLKESNQRNEVRVVSAYLKSDIEYSKAITLTSTTLNIVNSNNENISYYISGSGGNNYLVRKMGSTTEFKDIPNIEFNKVNDHLIKTKIITDIAKNKFTEFKIFKWEMKIVMPSNANDIIINDKVFVLSNQVIIDGSSTVSGTDATVIVKQGMNLKGGGLQYIATKKIYINGNLSLDNGAGIGKTDYTSSIYIKGSCTVDGDSRLYGNTVIEGNLKVSNPKLNGNIYVDGNFEIIGGSYEDFKKMAVHIYYTGTLKKPDYYGSIQATKVASVEDIIFPNIDIPPMKPDSWYAEKGYTSNATLRNNMKFIGANLNFKDWGNNTFTNVVIASKGDISLKGNVHVSGILFAPNGQVLIDGSSTFKGLIIANETNVTGDAHVTFEAVGITELPF